ncbi:MAG: hypothetical protein ABIA63_10460 [bacterium]
MENKHLFYKRMWMGEGARAGVKIYLANWKSFLSAVSIVYVLFCFISFYVLKKLGSDYYSAFCDFSLFFYILISPLIIRITIKYSLEMQPNTVFEQFTPHQAVHSGLTILIYIVMMIAASSSYTLSFFLLPIIGGYGFALYAVFCLVVLILASQTVLVLIVVSHEKRYFFKAFKRSLELVKERKTQIMLLCLMFFLIFNLLVNWGFIPIEKGLFSYIKDAAMDEKVAKSNQLYYIWELLVGALLSPLFFVYFTLYYFQIIKERDEFFY